MIDSSQKSFTQKNRRRMSLLIGVFILVSGYYSVVVPPFEAPDEIWHFAVIQHIAAGHGLPVASANTDALWKQQGIQAPLYYLIASALTLRVDQSDFPDLYARINPHAALGVADAGANRNFFTHHSSEAWPWRGSVLALHIARFVSVALGAITVWGTYRMLELLLAPELALIGAGIVAFIPQFVFLSSAASNDNAVNALSALVLWRLVAMVTSADSRPPARALVPLGCLLGLAILAKLSAGGLLVVTGLALLLVAWRVRSWRELVRRGLYVGLPALLVGGWWFARNWILYGNLMAWNMWRANVSLRLSPPGLRTFVAELEGLERSSWGVFGWMNVIYPSWVYSALRGFAVIVALGVVAGLVRWLLRDRVVSARAWGALLVVAWLGLLTVSWLRFNREAPAAQGRYLMPGLPAVAVLVAFSARTWQRRLPALPVYRGVLIFLVALNLVTPAWIIRPAYTAPASLPESAAALTPLQVDFGGQFRLTGVAAEPATLLPGEMATITLGWRALAPTTANYSVFIHLVDDLGLIIAQLDTMPGGGLLPTSQWQPGQAHIEAYSVEIPRTAYAPNRGRWVIGLYEHPTGQRLPVSAGASLPSSSVGFDDIAFAGDSITFGRVELAERPGATPNPLEAVFEDNIRLVGYRWSARELRPAEPLTVTLYWEASGPVARSYTLFAHLLDSNFGTFGGVDSLPPSDTRSWQAGEIVVTTHAFEVSPGAPPGFYQVEVGLYPAPSLRRLKLINARDAIGVDRVLLGPLLVSP
jgi:hypothetical protein